MPETRPLRYSIRGRAAILTSVLVAAALATFSWVTVDRVRADLIKRGIERAETTASTLAAQTSQTVQQGLARLNQVAAGPAVSSFLHQPTSETAQAVLLAARSPGITQEETVTIWDGAGRRLLDAPIGSSKARTIPSQDAPPAAAGVSSLLTDGEVLFTRSVAEIPSGADAPGRRAGYLVLSRVVQGTANTGVVNRVVGDGAMVLIANQSGSVWTDLGRIVAAPHIDLNQAGGREFLSADGQSMIGSTARIPGTPWVLVLAFPRAVILAPSWKLLGLLIAASIVIVAAATLGARALSKRVTQPLAELTTAVKAIGQGDYSRRVPVDGSDEVGELALAFNAMAQQVESGRRALEAHAAELSRSREAAKQANQSKDEFLAVLSHELRTPLNAILGWCQMLKAGMMPPGGTQQAIDVIERNATAQLRLVEDLLDVSRIVIGQFTLEKARVDVRGIVKLAVESLQPALRAKRIVLTTSDEPEGSSKLVLGDASRLQQAVWNLLSNAIKFTPAHGRIEIETRVVGAHIEIAIRDNGEGISATALPLIFDRLQQGDNGTTRRHGGLGLGLAIVRQIVELHHGTVSAESDGPGRGSTFRIRLPVAFMESDFGGPASLPQSHSEAEPRGRSMLAGVSILLVEDSDDAREMMERLLKISGAIVKSSADAQSAIEWLKFNAPDVIVSDIGMPGLDGWQMMKLLRAQSTFAGHAAPAIALTAHVTRADRERSMESGFQEHLAKPVDFDALSRLIVRLGAKSASESR